MDRHNAINLNAARKTRKEELLAELLAELLGTGTPRKPNFISKLGFVA